MKGAWLVFSAMIAVPAWAAGPTRFSLPASALPAAPIRGAIAPPMPPAAAALRLAAGDGVAASQSGAPLGAARQSASASFDFSGLATVDQNEHEWLSGVLAVATRSKTARGVLRKVERLAAQRRRPIIVTMQPIVNDAEYATDSEIVTIDRNHLRMTPQRSAGVLMHELIHAIQFTQGLPAEAFEFELEAYLIQFKVADELGYVAAPRSFHAKARRRLSGGVGDFITWLKKEYPRSISLTGSRMKAFKAVLVQRQLQTIRTINRIEERLRVGRSVVKRMEETAQPLELVARYRHDEIFRLERSLVDQQRSLAWNIRDLSLLSDLAGRQRYRAYSSRVLRGLRDYHRRLAR